MNAIAAFVWRVAAWLYRRQRTTYDPPYPPGHYPPENLSGNAERRD